MLTAMAAELHTSRCSRSGFTLIEIMVSIMIFIVVCGAMVAILILASNIFRQGEYGRSATDEAIGVVSTIEDDLKHIVPSADGGWFFSQVQQDTTGNCILAFEINNPDSSQIGANGSNSRLLVAYWVYANGGANELHRASMPLAISTTDPTGLNSKNALTNGIGVVGSAGPNPSTAQFVVRNAPIAVGVATNAIVTTGCLHFGTWLAIMGNATLPAPLHRPDGTIDWENDANGRTLPPYAGAEAYDTDIPQVPQPSGGAVGAAEVNWPFPNLVRISLILTGGGRYAPRGQIVSDRGSSLTITGISPIPSAPLPTSLLDLPGTVLRVDPAGGGGGGSEWITYTYSNGILYCANPRSALRTAVTTHARGDLVTMGRSYSIVRTLPQ